MLDMGFAPQLSQILRFAPQSRQTLLFSATWNSTMDDLSRRYLKSPIRISVAAASQAAQTISQSMISTTTQDKNKVLLDELNHRQGQRNTALSAFRDGRASVLVATDIAARGIDVARIAHVINYDLPQVPEDYVHRIGRTGRAGAQGSAVSLVTPEERSQWIDIERLLKKGGSGLPLVHGRATAY